MPGWTRFGGDELDAQAQFGSEILRRQAEMLRGELTRIESLLGNAKADKPKEPR
jgi:hypothetical protein